MHDSKATNAREHTTITDAERVERLQNRPGYDDALDVVRRYRQLVGDARPKYVIQDNTRGAWIRSVPLNNWDSDRGTFDRSDHR